MDKLMKNSVSNISKFSADALQKMLTAEQIPLAKSTKAADGAELTYAMAGWSKTSWKKSADGVIYKRCNDCGQWHPISDFPLAAQLNTRSRDGKSILCMSCTAQKKAEEAKEGKRFTVKLETNNTAKKLESYSDAQILRELRLRGYKGELTVVKSIVV